MERVSIEPADFQSGYIPKQLVPPIISSQSCIPRQSAGHAMLVHWGAAALYQVFSFQSL
jgi:hypothetical protein